MRTKEETKQELKKITNQIERAEDLISAISHRVINVGKYTEWISYIDEMRKHLYDLSEVVEKKLFDIEMGWDEE